MKIFFSNKSYIDISDEVIKSSTKKAFIKKMLPKIARYYRDEKEAEEDLIKVWSAFHKEPIEN